MSDTVITVENLCKAYLLGREERQDTLIGSLAAAIKSPLRNLRQLHRLNTFNISKKDEDNDDILWALDDVSFEVKQGEVLGIVGRNGAGKSTLLKILCRITKPTRGRATIRGRVSALLEVGTGFHPELTGRENVYLNGTILGMTKAEIDSKFDEIVEFSGVERFLDTPVKRYSSGMNVRLAFSVAAHLEPEILIIDEVLAVGDADFQKKCLGKMKDVSTGEGRTVIFVSHNMNAVLHLCNRVLHIDKGKIVSSGNPDEVVRAYIGRGSASSSVSLRDHDGRVVDGSGILQKIEIMDSSGSPANVFGPGEDVLIKLTVSSNETILRPRIGLGVTDLQNLRVFAVATYLSPDSIVSIGNTSNVTLRFVMPPVFPGQYNLDVAIMNEDHSFLDAIYAAASITVKENAYLNTASPISNNRELGVIMVKSEWKVEPSRNA